MRSLLCGLFLTACASAAFGVDVRLESFASGVDTVRIAVVPFPVQGGSLQADEPWKVVGADLAFSPRFRVLRASSTDTAAFLEKGIGIYVDGACRVNGESVDLEFHVRETVGGRSLLGKKYRGKSTYLRRMAHRFSNTLVESLLGERGVFESRIVFVRKSGDTKDIYLMDYDGHGMRRLTKTSTVNVFPAFADSSSIVWTSFLRGKPDIYRGSTATGRSAILIYSRSVETSPAVSMIEGRIAYASSRPGNLEIFTADLDKTNVRQLTFRGGIDTSPCWSPNGYQLAFTSDRSGQPQIYVMDADGTNTRRLTFEGSYQDSPSWSPKGDQIAYTSFQRGAFNIWTIGADGSDAMQITTQPGNNEYPCWSPNGEHIVFVCRQGGSSDLYTMCADGTKVRRLTKTGDALMPDWGP